MLVSILSYSNFVSCFIYLYMPWSVVDGRAVQTNNLSLQVDRKNSGLMFLIVKFEWVSEWVSGNKFD